MFNKLKQCWQFWIMISTDIRSFENIISAAEEASFAEMAMQCIKINFCASLHNL